MEEAQATYYLDPNEVKLSVIYDRLLIEVEPKAIGKSFSLELDNDVIAQVSQEIFSDVKTMYKGIEDALKKVNDEVSLSFDGNGQLTYKMSFFVGRVRKDRQFNITLQENESDPLILLEKKMENKFAQLFNKFSEIEQRIQPKVVNNNDIKRFVKEEDKEIAERMARLEEKVFNRLELLENKVMEVLNKVMDQGINSKTEANKSSQKIIKLGFDRLSPKATFFNFTDDDQTIEYTNLKSNGLIPFSPQLPKKGTFVLSLKIQKIPSPISFGVVSYNDLRKDRWHPYSFYYETQKGIIHYNGIGRVEPHYSDIGFGKVNDVLSFIMDAEQDFFFFKINGIEINRINYNIKDKVYYPYCQFGTGTKVTIIQEI